MSTTTKRPRSPDRIGPAELADLERRVTALEHAARGLRAEAEELLEKTRQV